jgi:hypothetical protein
MWPVEIVAGFSKYCPRSRARSLSLSLSLPLSVARSSSHSCIMLNRTSVRELSSPLNFTPPSTFPPDFVLAQATGWFFPRLHSPYLDCILSPPPLPLFPSPGSQSSTSVSLSPSPPPPPPLTPSLPLPLSLSFHQTQNPEP